MRLKATIFDTVKHLQVVSQDGLKALTRYNFQAPAELPRITEFTGTDASSQ